MASTSSSSVPASIPKSVLPTLARARELTTKDPVIAYWCKLKATQSLFDASPSDAQGREYLLSLIEDLEATKARLADNELIKDDLAGSAYVYNFASKVFDGADATDRAGKASMITAKEFLAASVFYEVLTVFGPLETDVADKIKYAKWKASSIAKAIKEGRTPEPGPAGGLASTVEEPSPEALAAAAAAASMQTGGNESSEEAEDVRRQLLPDTPGTAPPHADDEEGSNDEGDDAVKDALPNAPKDMPARTDDEDSLLPSVPGGIGSASSLSHGLPEPPPPPPEAHQPPPPPITFSLPPPSAPTASLRPSAPPRTISSNMPNITAPSAPPALQPAAAAASGANGHQYGTDEDWRPEPATVDPTTIANAQKHAKWAISALNYEDLETARKELRLALQLIGG